MVPGPYSPGMATIGAVWRVLDGATTAWFETTSLTEGAALAGRVLELSPDARIDLRTTGVQVRLGTTDHADEVSSIAHDLGLTANPTVLQQLGIVIESADPAAVSAFWQGVLAYTPTEDGGLIDPLSRDPGVRIRPSTEPLPLRNRVHVDVVRPALVVEKVNPGEPSGPYGVRHTDPDGNEVDLVPGGALDGDVETADWQTVFSAMACYRVSSTTQQCDLVMAAAAAADRAGFPLLIDVRPGLVILDSGKDQWEDDAHGLQLRFAELAGDLQAAVHALGATADPALPRFVQLFVDAADVPAVRAFWVAALGYSPDRRPEVTDLHDPRRFNPELVFQELDAADTARRRQRNRIHLELTVPADVVPGRLDAVVAAGGRTLDGTDSRRRVVDPEGNELVIVT